jgi:Zn finger protein HypA/HybF involved in hydrogenase expression
MDKTKIECRKCGKICEVETHELRDVIDVVCPKCGSEHIFIRDIHLDT